MNLYRSGIFLSTEFIACKRDTMTFLYETENKRTRMGEYDKVWDCFRHYIFSLLFFFHQHGTCFPCASSFIVFECKNY